MEDLRPHIQQIHDAPHKAVLAVSGAGTQAVAWLLGVSGASRTILEAVVPYGRLSMAGFLGFEPKQSASAGTARQLAQAAYRKAKTQLEDDSPAIGLACAATIATDRPKRGEHRAFIATWSDETTLTYSLHLQMGQRDRAGEEDVVSRLIVSALASASGLEIDIQLGLTGGDFLTVARDERPDALAQLLSGEARWLTAQPGELLSGKSLPGEALIVEGRVPAVLLPGSFNPLHQGHRGLAQAASDLLGEAPAYELSVINVDKPPLKREEIFRRLAQFEVGETVVLTTAETFHKKAGLFPGRTFVIGWDTAVRLVAPRYYGNTDGGDETAMLAALAEMWAGGTRFLVAGRQDQDAYKTLADVPIPQGFAPIFTEVPEGMFREDISSTELRGHGMGSSPPSS